MKMVLFKLINGIEYKLDTSRIDLYWKKYAYRALIKFPCVNRTRYYNKVDRFKDDLEDEAIKYVRNFSLLKMIHNVGGNVEDLCKFIEWRSNLKDIKLSIRKDSLCLYYNDLEVVQSFLDCGFLSTQVERCTYRETGGNYEKGVVYHQNPKHNYRIYLNRVKLDRKELQAFQKILIDHRLRPCPTIDRNIVFFHGRIVKEYFYFWQSNFIDGDDESAAVILALHFPDLINRICRIEKRNKINTP